MPSHTLTRLSNGRISRSIAVVAALVVTGSLLSFSPALSAAADEEPVPFLGTPVPGSSAPAADTPAEGASSDTLQVQPATLPAPATFTVTSTPGTTKNPITSKATISTPASTTTGDWTPLGMTGISIAAAAPQSFLTDTGSTARKANPAAQTVTATIVDQATASKNGFSGLVLQLSTPTTTVTPVAVQLPASLLKGVYGADYAGRTRWVQIPTTGTPAAQRVAATTDSTTSNTVLTPMVSSASIMVAAVSEPVSSTGTGSFTATSLKPATSWDVSAQTGDFSWSYPMRTPPAAAGPAPSLNLTYDSQSVDGETGSSNNQPSAIGDGWSLGAAGFIERTYVSCSQDNGPSGAVKTSGDLCWKTDNATISLGGHSGQLVKDSTTGTWKLQSDDGSRIEHLTGTAQGCAANGTYDTDCWRLTTRDGTQYYFGLNRLPGWTGSDVSTRSVFTVPVFGNDPGEPCHASTFAASSCTQAWRWNLDYVVDAHNNAEALYYTAETNKYALNGVTATSYTRGGQLDHIDYGLTASSVYDANAASDKVAFGYNQYGRCSDTDHSTCTTETITSPAVKAATPASYPDVPFDQFCSGTTCPTLLSPTFWTTGMLDTVTTKTLESGSYATVDKWDLGHSFPDPGDGTDAALWLTKVTHTGYSGADTLTEPATTFTGTTMQNRVWTTNGLAPLYKWRISSIKASTGAVTSVNYSGKQCLPENAAAIEASPQTNTSRCFPQWWTPDTTNPQPAAIDLFHKYVVTSVISNPVTGGGNDRPQETTYSYGSPAWRYDNSPLTVDAQRTWSQYAGYNTVKIQVGGAGVTPQTTKYNFYQGMDGDRANASGGTKTVHVAGSSTLSDSLWFAGTVRQTQVLDGPDGAALSTTVNTPWASNVTANDGTLTARLTGTTETVRTEPLSTTGISRTVDTKTTNDGTYGYPLTVNTATSDAGTTCTTTSYAAPNTTDWLIGLPAEVKKVGADCSNLGAATYPDDAISDTRTSYDNAAAGVAVTTGNVTKTEAVNSYPGTTAANPHWVTTSTASYDAFGRVTSSTDALNHTNSTAYTPAATSAAGSGPLTSTLATNAAGWTTTTTYEPAWGAETSIKDANNKLTTAAYDALGRRTKVWLPAWPQADHAGQPSTSYAYTLSQTGPNAVTTTTSNANLLKQTVTLFDGLGQQVQTQTNAEGGGIVVTDTGYNSAGQVSLTNNSYWTQSVTTPSANLFVPDGGEAQIPSATVTSYDSAGRPLTVVLNSNLNEQSRTSYAYPGAERTNIIPPAGGTPTATYTNTRGQKTSLVQYLSSSISGSKETTTYGYDPAGNMTSMTDQAGNDWTWSFDVLGRQTSATDPDTGTTTSTYDLAGNVLTATDARNITLAYSYDSLNRKLRQFKDTASLTTGTLLASWSYDPTGDKGQLARSTSYPNATTGAQGSGYTDTVTGYDDNYKPTGETITIPADAPAFGGTTYTTGMSYYPDGAIQQKTYPAVGGIPAENLKYLYGGYGVQTSLIGISSYANTVYTAIGQIAQYGRRGTGVSYTDYGYDPATGSVLSIEDRTFSAGVTTEQADRVYTRDDANNITSVKTTGSAATDTQCYNYDHLQNLTSVWTPTSNSCTAAPTATTIGGPAPIWKTYTVDPGTGNRTSATTNPISSTGTTSIATYNYPAAGTARPHAVQTIGTAVSGSTTTTTKTYTYDNAGDTTTRNGQALTYTPTGKISTITSGSNTQTDIYDAAGTLLLQQDPTDGATLFLGDTQLRQAAGSTSTSVVRTYSANGQPIAERTAAAGATTSTLNWISTDIDGTADLEIGATTGTVKHRYQDPYGNTRGSTVTWSSPNRYLNQPKSTFSSLTQIGARAYDATTGRFLTVDPVLSPFEPQQNNGYSYSHNSPITFSDPTGLKPPGQYDNDWQGDTNQSGGGTPIQDQNNSTNGPGAYQGPPAPGQSTPSSNGPSTCVAVNPNSCRSGSSGKIGTATNSTTGGTGPANLPYQAWVTKSFASGVEAASQILIVCAMEGVGAGFCKAGADGLDILATGEKTYAAALESADAQLGAKTYQTYIKINEETGMIYAGRTSGTQSAAMNLFRRDANHAYSQQGFGPAILDKSSSDYAAIRGREQYLIDNFRAQGVSANKINGISPTNPNRPLYQEAAENAFGGN